METINNLKAIIAFLAGSLGTLLIKEVFNQINRRVDFKRDLHKQKFTRKLDKAEKAVGFYTTYLSTITEMKKSLELILKTIKEDKDLEISIINEILNQNSQNLSELMRNSYADTNSVYLYFDLDDLEKWNETDASNFQENLAETKFKDSEIQFWLNIYNSHLEKDENEKADFYWNKTQEMLPDYADSIQKVVDSLEKNRLAVSEMIKKIKLQL